MLSALTLLFLIDCISHYLREGKKKKRKEKRHEIEGRKRGGGRTTCSYSAYGSHVTVAGSYVSPILY